jgi:opacity protein-like surface antigen
MSVSLLTRAAGAAVMIAAVLGAYPAAGQGLGGERKKVPFEVVSIAMQGMSEAVVECDIKKYKMHRGHYDNYIQMTSASYFGAVPIYPHPCKIRTTNIRGSFPMAPAPAYASFEFFAGVDVCGATASSAFAVNPAFSGDASGGLFGGHVGVRLSPQSAGPVFFDARFGVLAGNPSGTKFYPTSGFNYTTGFSTIVTGDVGLGIFLNFSEPNFPRSANPTPVQNNWSPVSVEAFVGIAEAKRDVTGTFGTFAVTDSNSSTGMTAGLRAEAPISPWVALTFEGRYIHFPGQNFKIPGDVSIDTDAFSATVGLNFWINRNREQIGREPGFHRQTFTLGTTMFY